MNSFRVLLKTETKLGLRSLDGILFGILFPMMIAIVLGMIYGDKPAFEGAEYTFMQQSFGAVASFGICATGLMGIPLTLADYRDRKILKRFKVTPVSPGLLLIIQLLIQFAIAIVSAVMVFAVVTLFFDYQMTGSIGGFLFSYLLVVLAIYSIGMMLASLSPNLKTANLLCTLIYFPMIFFSGATIPYEVMPKAMQKVTNFLPLTQGIKLLKGYSLGLSSDGLLFPTLLMTGIAIVCVSISIKFFKWE